MSRAEILARISDRLDDRELIWFGIRGHDATPLLQIPQFRSSFSITAGLEAATLERSVSLESLTGIRVDLDQYDIDFDDAPEVTTLRQEVMARCNRKSAVVTYRPSHFLSAIHFACFDTVDYLGMFKEQQAAFEHKPWVETALRRSGLRTVPWQYVAAERREMVEELASIAPVILRPSKTSGGVGIHLAASAEDVSNCWAHDAWDFTGVAPFFANAIPLNIAGCVFRSANAEPTVTIHPLSMQLIGVDGVTGRRFGYCGNDFSVVAALAEEVLDEIDETTRAVGNVLGGLGYVGAFGVDYLLDGDTLYFSEVNARLQGSTSLASAQCMRAGRSDVLLDHVAANLGLAPVESLSVRDWINELDAASHIVVHNTSTQTVVASQLDPPDIGSRHELVAKHGIGVEPGGVLYRLVVPRSVTRTGFEISQDLLPGH